MGDRMIFIGIDPGLNGAVAAIDDNGRIISLQDVPTLTLEKAPTAKARAKAKAAGKTVKGHKRVYVESQMAALLDSLREGSAQLALAIHESPSPEDGGIVVMIEN